MADPKRKTNLRKRAGGRAVHDIGGVADSRPIDRHEHELTLYEKRVDAMVMLLGGAKRGAFKIDALRRVIEEYAEQEYDSTDYYDKWVRALRNLLVEQEILSREELEMRIGIVRRELQAEGRKVSNKSVPW
jgi:hypothetical protein